MKRRPVSVNVKINGSLPDADDAAIIAHLQDLLVGMIGFTLEMNGMDGVTIQLDESNVQIGEAEDGPEVQSQMDKLVDVIKSGHATVVGIGSGEDDDPTIH